MKWSLRGPSLRGGLESVTIRAPVLTAAATGRGRATGLFVKVPLMRPITCVCFVSLTSPTAPSCRVRCYTLIGAHTHIRCAGDGGDCAGRPVAPGTALGAPPRPRRPPPPRHRHEATRVGSGGGGGRGGRGRVLLRGVPRPAPHAAHRPCPGQGASLPYQAPRFGPYLALT